MKYKQGDILQNKDDKRKVLGVCGEIYFMSNENDLNTYWSGYTEKELDNNGYTLVTPEWSPENGSQYYFIDLDANRVYSLNWDGCEIDKNRKSYSLAFPYTPQGRQDAEKRLAEVISLLKK